MKINKPEFVVSGNDAVVGQVYRLLTSGAHYIRAANGVMVNLETGMTRNASEFSTSDRYMHLPNAEVILNG